MQEKLETYKLPYLVIRKHLVPTTEQVWGSNHPPLSSCQKIQNKTNTVTLLRKENTICRVTDNLIKGDGCCHTPAQFVGTKSFLISKDGNNVDETHKEISMEFFSFIRFFSIFLH